PQVLLEAADTILEDGQHEGLLARRLAVAAGALEELLGEHDVGREEVDETLGGPVRARVVRERGLGALELDRGGVTRRRRHGWPSGWRATMQPLRQRLGRGTARIHAARPCGGEREARSN